MLVNFSSVKIYVYSKSVDMRKSVNGLSIIVSDSLSLDPSNGDLYVLTNKLRTRLKVLFYHQNGYCIFYKSLSEGLFSLPKSSRDRLLVSKAQLDWLLSGIMSSNVKQFPGKHLPKISY